MPFSPDGTVRATPVGFLFIGEQNKRQHVKTFGSANGVEELDGHGDALSGSSI